MGNRLTLEVTDDGPGFSEPWHDGVGLFATRERLAVRYREHAHLTCSTGPDGGAVVAIEIPLGDE